MHASPRRASLVAPAAAALTAVLALGPLAILAVTSVARNWYWPALAPHEWSVRSWRYLVSGSGPVGGALLTSAVFGVAVAILSVAIALPAGQALAGRTFRGRRLLVFALLLPVLVPPLAAAMGLHAVFLRIGLVDSPAGVALVHLIPAVPYATLMMAGSFANLDPGLAAQARTLGAGPVRVWTRVLLPVLWPGVAVAAAFAFLISWSQYLLTLLIGGGRVLTLPLLLVNFQRGGDDAVAGALSLVFIAPTLLLFGIVARGLKEMG
jgi:putative spermidine/putrescine transport system permease protein